MLREFSHAHWHRLLICGDFKVHNTSWGGFFSSVCGRDLSDFITGLHLLVLNDGSSTFQAPSASSNVLHLTVASSGTQLLWPVESNTWGSDHYPIPLTSMHSERRPTRRYKVTHWQTFRFLIGKVSDEEDLKLEIQSYLGAAAKTMTRPSRAPLPDQKYLNQSGAPSSSASCLQEGRTGRLIRL